MKELSLHLLDIVQNSIAAGAAEVEIAFRFHGSWLTLTIEDNGRGMEPEFLASVLDPFTTSRTTRSVGLGLPLLRLTAEQTGGGLRVESAVNRGTLVRAELDTGHIDCPPMGDLGETLSLLIQGAPEVNFVFEYAREGAGFRLDTRELREILGEDVSLAEPEVVLWLKEYLAEGLSPWEMEETT